MDVVVLVRRPLGSVRLDGVVGEWEAAAQRLEQRTQSARIDLARRESRLANGP